MSTPIANHRHGCITNAVDIHLQKVKKLDVADLKDENVTTFSAKGGAKLKTERRIYIHSVVELYKMFCGDHIVSCLSATHCRA